MSTPPNTTTTDLTFDVAIIGGSFGGVAAAVAAADTGAEVVLATPTDWIGGQVSNQGVSALDEHVHIESFGGTRMYETFRERIRRYYRDHHGAPENLTEGQLLNPGNAWVSRLCFEPSVGHQILSKLLSEEGRGERITVLKHTVPINATVDDGRVASVTVQTAEEDERTVGADVVLDATEWGDLLPLVGAEYVTGAEAKKDTSEAHAPPTARPNEIQSFTYCFAVKYRPGEDHTIKKPADYERMREDQPYTFEYTDHAGEVAHYRMFEKGPDGERPFWTYRRLIDASLLDGYDSDVALINWNGNDYYRRNPIDVSEDERAEIFADAKRLAKGLLYWLQTDAPREDGSETGYPGLRLLPDVMGTEDGLSKQPYVRECRRIIPQTRVEEGDIATASNRGSRARNFRESVGIGYYGMDLHSCVGNPRKVLHEPTLPYQIPFGALIPRRGPTNFLAGCKNIGTTHITNGAYRLHPTEWAIGEAAGFIAARTAGTDVEPPDILASPERLCQVQAGLLERGVPLTWTIDIPSGHELFVITQLLYVWGAIPRTAPRYHRLEVGVDKPLTCGELHGLATAAVKLLDQTATIPAQTDTGATATRTLVDETLEAAGFEGLELDRTPTWADVCAAVAPPILRHVGTKDR